MRPGMHGGTMSFTNWGPKKWSAPKTASGIAKHSELRATILSRPWAWAISFFVANSAIKRSAMPAAHMATATGASRTVARMIRCMVSVRLREVERRCQTVRDGQPGQRRHQPAAARRVGAHHDAALLQQVRDEGLI